MAGQFFSKWAVCSFKDDTGLGRMATDIQAVLGLGHHLVVPSERLKSQEISGVNERLLLPTDSSTNIESLLDELEGIICLERPNWHPDLLRIAKSMGIITVCVPMWEWFTGTSPDWDLVDLIACPSRFTETIVRSYGYTNTCSIYWPLDLAKLPSRTISGPARHFIHNAGLIDHDDRKGTRDTIKAFKRLKRKDVSLTVRLQKDSPLPLLDERIEVIIGNCPNPADLYATGDICVQPSKMEGIGFMVLEPACAGMPVITTDYPPMNEFIRQPNLRCRTRWRKRKAFPTNWIPHAHLKLPSITDLTRKMEWAASHDLASISQSNRAWAERTFDPIVLRRSWELLLSQISRREGNLDRPAAPL